MADGLHWIPCIYQWEETMFRMNTTQYNRLVLWGKLLLFSLVCHLIFLSWLFFMYRNDAFDFALTVSTRSLTPAAHVVLVPIKHVQAKAIQPVTKPKKAVLPKTPPTTLKSVKKLVPAKPLIKQTIKKSNSKKMVEKKIEPSPKKPEPIVQQTQKKDLTVRVGYRDVEAMRRYNLLQKELVKHWHPPIGIPENCNCQIQILVAWDGAIQDMKMIKESGLLMFDIAARSALFAMSLPKWAYGKSITITFE